MNDRFIDDAGLQNISRVDIELVTLDSSRFFERGVTSCNDFERRGEKNALIVLGGVGGLGLYDDMYA